MKSAAIEKSVVVASSTEARSFGISLNSASDFVSLRPPVSLIAAGAIGAMRRWLLSRKVKPNFLSFVVQFFQTEVKFPRESADRLFAQTGDVYSQDAAGA